MRIVRPVAPPGYKPPVRTKVWMLAAINKAAKVMTPIRRISLISLLSVVMVYSKKWCKINRFDEIIDNLRTCEVKFSCHTIKGYKKVY